MELPVAFEQKMKEMLGPDYENYLAHNRSPREMIGEATMHSGTHKEHHMDYKFNTLSSYYNMSSR